MAGDGGAAGGRVTGSQVAELLDAIAAKPHEFDLFHALRRLEAAHPDMPLLGESARPSQDPIRIGQEPSLKFAPRPIAGVVARAPGARSPRLLLYSFGLFGPNAPLPTHLTEYAFTRGHNHADHAFARFADIFHHRLATLWFRAWAESEPAVSYDRPKQDRFGMQLGALAGYGMASLRDRDAMPDLVKLHFVGRLASRTRNPDGLRALLASFFEANVTIKEFVPTWVQLPPASLCFLGCRRETGTLGSTATAGSKIKVYHHRFRIVLGPLRLAQYQRLLPGGPALKRLLAIVRNYVGDELDWELNLVLRWNDAAAVRLGRSGQLGWTTWVGDRACGQDADDLTLAADAARASDKRAATAALPASGSLDGAWMELGCKDERTPK